MGNQIGILPGVGTTKGAPPGANNLIGASASVGVGIGTALVVTAPPADAVDDVFAFIQLYGMAGLQTGWGLVKRRQADKPLVLDRLVVVTEDGGPGAEIERPFGIGDSARRDVGVIVTVRAAAWDSPATKAKAMAIMAALHGLMNAVVGATLYNRVRAMTPEPIFTGFDDTGRPRHTVAFRLMTVAA